MNGSTSLKQIPRLAVKPEFVYRLFYPQVPLILCAKSKGVSSMPVASAVSVSDNPPKIAVAVKKELRTNKILNDSSAFSLNWIDFKKKDIVTKLSKFRASSDRDKLRSLKISYRIVLGAPVLEESVAYLILRKEKKFDVGDHNLFLGRVLGSRASLDFDEYWSFRKYSPILYLGSEKKKQFATL